MVITYQITWKEIDGIGTHVAVNVDDATDIIYTRPALPIDAESDSASIAYLCMSTVDCEVIKVDHDKDVIHVTVKML